MEPAFSWGPVARAIYTAMLWFTLFVVWIAPEYLLHYGLLLLFVGVGLRPLLAASGLHALYQKGFMTIDEKRWAKRTEQRRREVERKERDDQYRKRRTRDPKLPKNW